MNKHFDYFKANHFQSVFKPFEDLKLLKATNKSEIELIEDSIKNKSFINKEYFRLVHEYLLQKHVKNYNCLNELQFAMQIIGTICYNLIKFPWRAVDFHEIRTYTGQMQFLYSFFDRDIVNGKILKTIGFEENYEKDRLIIDADFDRGNVYALAYDSYLMFYYYQKLDLLKFDKRCKYTPGDLVEILHSNKELTPIDCEEILKLQPKEASKPTNLVSGRLENNAVHINRGDKPNVDYQKQKSNDRLDDDGDKRSLTNNRDFKQQDEPKKSEASHASSVSQHRPIQKQVNNNSARSDDDNNKHSLESTNRNSQKSENRAAVQKKSEDQSGAVASNFNSDHEYQTNSKKPQQQQETQKQCLDCLFFKRIRSN